MGDLGRWISADKTVVEPDAIRFLMLTGLVELGEIEIVRDCLAESLLNDERLNAAIHFGLFFFNSVRSADGAEKGIVGECTKLLAPHIERVVYQLRNELKGELVEMRRGALVVLDEREVANGGQSTLSREAP